MDINETKEYLKKIKLFQSYLQNFIDDQANTEEEFQNIINFLQYQKVQKCRYELQEILYLIIKSCNNRNRTSSFFEKLEQILFQVKDAIRQNFSNSEIFHLFKSNKRILLFLFREKLLTPDESIINYLKYSYKRNHILYFYPEIKNMINGKYKQELERLLSNAHQDTKESFEKKRNIGENDSYICELIRNDLIDQFISYVNQKNILLSSHVESSIFETNPYLLKNEANLIEYSAFFGSVQIFRYLYKNGVEMNSSLWCYAIHGRNPEMINILEECCIEPNDKMYKEFLKESIKCHHNEIASYIQNNFIENTAEINQYISLQAIKYRNFAFFPEDLDNPIFFNALCHYNYIQLVEMILETSNININIAVIRFLISLSSYIIVLNDIPFIS